MTYSPDFRWRAVSLLHVYGIHVGFISDIFGPKPRTVFRWYSLFLEKGVVDEDAEPSRSSRWPSEVVQDVQVYVKDHPTFTWKSCSRFYKRSTSKSLMSRAARESVPEEVSNYKAKLHAIYSYPEQLIFIDETSKDGCHAYRRYGWSSRNTKCVVKLPFSRGQRRSIFAALDYQGFAAWETTEWTFTRSSFHRAFLRNVIPLLNPWPLPRSIVRLC